MEWKISYLSDKHVMLTEVTGECDAVNTLPMIKTMCEEAQRYDCFNWLLDMRAAVRHFNTLDYYRRPDVYFSLAISSTLRKAVVFPKIDKQELFYQTVCRNRGYFVSVFSDLGAAMNWLESFPGNSTTRRSEKAVLPEPVTPFK